MRQQSSDPTTKALVDETLEDHRATMKAVAAIERCLDRQPDAAAAWVGALMEELPKLGEILRCHFTEEQEGALYRSLPVSRPRFAERLRKLEAEHARIIRAVEDAIERGRSLHDPQLHDVREFNAQVQLLVAMIRRHEAEENEIIFEAYWDEVGTGD